MNPRTRIISWIVLATVGIGLLAVAGLDGRGAETQAERIQRLNESFACPVCDGESVADSSAGVAASIRAFIRDEVNAGRSDTEIRDQLIDSYTVEVLLNPPSDGFAAIIWVLPVIVIATGAGLVATYVTRHGDDDSETTDRPDDDAKASQPQRWRQPVLATTGLVAVAAVAGFGLARFSGERGVGDQLTGEIDSSPRTQSAQCQALATSGAANGFLESVKCFDEILVSSPDHPEALAYRGWYLLMASGQVAGPAPDEAQQGPLADSLAEIADIAIESFSRAIEVAPTYPDPYVFRAVAMDRRGESAAVCADLEILLSLDPPEIFISQTSGLIKSNGCDDSY